MVKYHQKMFRTFEMLDSNLILTLQLFQLLERLFLALLLVLGLRDCSLDDTSLLFTNDQELSVYIVKELWLQRHPPEASKFVKDPNNVSEIRRLMTIQTYSLG